MSENYDSAFFDLRPAKYRTGDTIRLKDEKLVKVIGVDPTAQGYMVMDSYGKSYPVKPDEISNKLNIQREKSPEELQAIQSKEQEELSLNAAAFNGENGEAQDVQQPIQQTQSPPDTNGPQAG